MAAGPRSGYPKTSRRRRLMALGLLLVVAFGVRLGVGLARRDEVYRLGDSQIYRRIGQHLAEGHGLVISRGLNEVGPKVRHADRMPGYPLILALLRTLFGEDTVSLLVLQAAIGAGGVYLVFLLGREAFAPLAGAAAAVMVALAPWQVYFATVALTECWSATLLAATILCAVRAVRRKTVGWALLAGVSCAALVYVHPGFLGLPLMVLPLALAARGRRQWVLRWLVATVIVVAALVPWWARNWAVYDRFVPTTTRLGVTLYDGLREGATGGTDMRFERNLMGETSRLSELEYDAFYRRRSWEAVQADPGRAVRLAAAKFGRLWSPVPRAAEAQSSIYRALSLAAYVPMVGGAMLGLLVLVRRRPRILALLLVPIAWVTMVHLVLVGSVRYRVPVEPLAFLLAGVAAAWVIEGEARGDER